MIMREERGVRFGAWQRALACGVAAAALALTVGAGLFGRATPAEARMLEGVEVAQQTPAGGVGRGVVRRGQEPGPAVREVEQAAESGVYFEQAAGAPVAITEARMRMITREQLRRADEEEADSSGDDESPFFVTLPTLTLANVSGKVVREVGVGFVTGGRVNVVAGYAASMKPGESRTIRSDWRRRNVIIPGTFADVSVRVVWVTFEDGTQWGERPRAPRPPAPPAPPAPPLPDDPEPRGGGSSVGSKVSVGAAGGGQALYVPGAVYTPIARAARKGWAA